MLTGTTTAFWENRRLDEQIAAIDARTGNQWSYARLHQDAAGIQASLPKLGRKSLGLLISQNRYECLTSYLAALQAGSALILVDGSLNPVLREELIAAYRPDWVYSADAGLVVRDAPEEIEVHPDLALLLSTSGSTGSPKLVRLSLGNLTANAASIAEYLQLTAEERPITSLPMSYSYGLSVINSHLLSGATLILTDDGILRREFWEAVDRHACTSFAGVPYTYRMLLQTGLLHKKGASLRTLTQAGGRLDEDLIRQMHGLAVSRGWKFMVMYGQTEATARISYVPFEQLGRKIGSVGIALPGGSLSVDEATGELLYSGPNVMLGYAACREDLAKGDDLRGVLRTGDLARQDADGYFYITGRLKRFLKLFGKRFSLDDMERVLSRRFEAAVACYGCDDSVTAAVERCQNPQELNAIACEIFDLPRTALKVIAVGDLPRTANGKLDYQRLAGEAPERAAVMTR